MAIRRLLIANRGEIACRIVRTCRAMGIETVAVHSDPDADAPFVHAADLAVPLGGTTPATSYLRADAIVDAALRSGADAVHPGYGFLSENAGFAQACIDAGLVWVGPSPDAIAAMGSKLAARELMTAAGVPVVPGVDLRDLSPPEVAAAVANVGYPVLVKASAGGGGRGMRIVRDAAALADAIEGARREAASAFGDDTVFVERFVDEPRHIEVQVFGDAHGTVVHLFERECSIQRRHQKIIEEAPSPFADDALREAICSTAVRAASAVGYVGAGTVEFIVAPDGTFFFLEMNTRLQVEHPVTEAITGLDLVRLQLLVAEGAPLPPEARDARIHGHAIEARVYAEDPDHDYLPSPGRIDRFEVPAEAGVRVDAGVATGDTVSPNYDPMLAKVIAHAPSRSEAARLLAHTMRRSRIDGPTTNRELLVSILEHDEFVAGRTDTGFLDRHPPRSLTAGRAARVDVEVGAIAAALAQQAAERRAARVLPAVPSGFRNNPARLQSRTYRHDGAEVVVAYALGRNAHVEVDGSPVDVTVLATTPSAVDLVVDGIRRRVEVADHGATVVASTGRGSVTFAVVPRFPPHEPELRAGSLVAPMPGTVVRVDTAAGSGVRAGAVLAVIEAMKMEHTISAPVDGVVLEVLVRPGQVVDAGTVLVVLGEGDAS